MFSDVLLPVINLHSKAASDSVKVFYVCLSSGVQDWGRLDLSQGWVLTPRKHSPNIHKETRVNLPGLTQLMLIQSNMDLG